MADHLALTNAFQCIYKRIRDEHFVFKHPSERIPLLLYATPCRGQHVHYSVAKTKHRRLKLYADAVFKIYNYYFLLFSFD